MADAILLLQKPCIYPIIEQANHDDPTPWNVITDMNFQPPSPKGRTHRFYQVLSLILVQNAMALGSAKAFASTRLPVNQQNGAIASLTTRPYLKIIGMLPLQFSEQPQVIALPSSALTEQSPSTFPSKDELPATSSSANAAVEPLVTKAPMPEETAPAPTPEATIPISILSDDSQPAARPEDFLPFFQFPAGGDVTVVVPTIPSRAAAPGQLPRSSATYQQK